MYFGDHNVQMAFGDRLSPALDIAFGKWFTPGIGVRAMYGGLSIKVLKTEVTLQAKSMMPLNGSTNRNSTL